MVLRMWDFDVLERDGEEWEMVRRALAAALQVAAYCFVSFDRNSKFKGLEAVQGIYEELQGRTGVEVVRFFYLESSAKVNLLGSMLRESIAYEGKPYAQYTTFVPIPTASELTGIAKSLLERYPARRYLETHTSPDSDSRPIEKICIDVEIIVKVSNLDLTFSAFLELVPIGPQKEAIEERLKTMGEMHSKLSQATVRPLFQLGEEGRYVLDDELLDLVRANFDPEQPTVVMVVLGSQGLGKSTFCNYLIQFCTQSRFCHDYFHAANSTTHTTRGSHFLTSPLSTPSQLLLIDMEGLGGTETMQQKAALLQSSLVGAVLAVASVPCFLVRNEVETLRDVQKYLEKLVWLARTLGFRMERILFLFHDRDFSPSQKKTENREISAWIQQLNRLYFNDSPVILLLNKPNFVDPSKADMRNSFLSQVLSEAAFPKRSISGTGLNIRELLVQIRYLGEGLERDAGNLMLEEAEIQGLKFMEKVKKEELERLVLTLESTGASLVLLFNEKIRIFLSSLEDIRESQKIKRRLRAFLDERIREQRWSLIPIEALYMSLSTLDDSQLQAKVEEKVQALYSESFCLPTFLSKCSSLEASLHQVAVHYPLIRPQITLAISYLGGKKTSSTWKSIANYAVNIGLAAATGGLGAAASGTRVAVTAARYGWGAVSLGGLATLKYAKDLVSGMKSKKSSSAVKLEGDRLRWDAEAVQSLSTGGDKCVVLVLGREGIASAEVLNSVLVSISGMELNLDQSLTSSNGVQIVTCSYPTRNCECLLFYLQFSATAKSASDYTLSALASALFPAVSCVCIFSGQESDHLMNIISTGLIGCERNRPVLAVFTSAGQRKCESALRTLVWETGLSTVYKEVGSWADRDKEVVQVAIAERLQDARSVPPKEIERMMFEARRSLGRMEVA